MPAIHRVDKAVHSTVYDFIMRKFHLQVSSQAQLASHVAEDALEERIDGLDAEMRVVMQNGSQGFSGLHADLLFCNGSTHLVEAFHDSIEIWLSILQFHLQPIESFQNAALHLGRRFVREGNGQRLLEPFSCIRLQEFHNVFHGQSKCLARTC